MRILMTTTNASLMDGINRHILTIAKALKDKDNIEVVVCTVFPKGDLNEALEREGITTYSLNARNGHQLSILYRFASIVKNVSPDIIHIHVIAIFERFILSFFFHHVPCIVTCHGIGGACGWLEKLLTFFSPLNIRGYCSVSKGVEEFYRKQNPKEDNQKWHIVYNPIRHVDTMSRAIYTELGISAEEIIIGTACRVAAIKNPLAFTEIMLKMLAHNDKIHAVLIGDGDAYLMGQIQVLVRKANMEHRFHFLGYRKDSSALISGFSFFIMTSSSEGLPTAMLEAMSSGVPVAFWSGRGGLGDLMEINDSCQFGVCRPIGDVENLVSDMEGVLSDEKKWRELSSNACHLCDTVFSLDAAVDKLLSVYNSAINR